ncbi:MAG TPA: hypothetical protein VHC49_01470, partial [Mycobacteriales bacterium]|nr:hypothetical protein [Mycobacteriales bacterium]
VACGALLVLASRLPQPVRAGAVAVLVTFDLTAFTLTVIQEGSGGDSGGSSEASVQTAGTSVRSAPLTVPAKQIGRDGRFLIYGPDGIGSRSVGGVGDPDLNVIAQRYSVQGYTAAVDARYASTTGTHGILAGGQHAASLWALESGVLDQLSAKYLITQPNRLLSMAATDKSAERHVERTADVGQTQTWTFGEVLRLSRVSVPVSSDSHRIRLGLRSAGGPIHWLRAQNAGGFLTADIQPAMDATALVLQPTDQTVTATAPALSLSDGRDFIADGDLQSVLENGGWQFAGNMDGYAVFTNPQADPMLSVRSGTDATVRRTRGDPMLPESVTVSSPHGTDVVRAVAAIRGWTATWTPEHGPSRALPVRTHGLVQAVTVPAGTGTLQWRYRTPHFVLGMVLSLVGVVLVAGAGGYALVRRRR